MQSAHGTLSSCSFGTIPSSYFSPPLKNFMAFSCAAVMLRVVYYSKCFRYSTVSTVVSFKFPEKKTVSRSLVLCVSICVACHGVIQSTTMAIGFPCVASHLSPPTILLCA